MKVKDLERTANVAWSPKTQTPIYLAAGTAAQQLDASFNTNATLEIYSLNLTEPGPDMTLKTNVPSEHRFHKIIWGAPAANEGNGLIVAGCDGGLIQIYNVTKLFNNEEDGLVSQPNKHSGPVHALDFNPFQSNLFATGAGESEIFIWDINNTNTPMTPGTKSQPSEDVLSVSWNRQVQHILASTFAMKCVIWDLRKNEPIIKLTDTVSRVRWKSIAWHPDVATQLCLASEEDHSPIIQLWDLRFATSPLKTLENHQRGILSMAWCQQDSNLLISCGKDNRILCWNPNSNEQPNGEVLAEIAKTNQWNFDIEWCPKNPAIIACPSYDGHVSIYSLMGGKTQQIIQTTNKIADSFPGMDDGYLQAPVPQQGSVQGPVCVDLKRPPKWMRRPVGASFGFGGKLICVVNNPQNDQVISRKVQISQVITEPDLVQKSVELEQALEYGNFTEYCRSKADDTDDQHKKYIWHFLKANFHDNPRVELLNLLGYRIEDINNKLDEMIGKRLTKNSNVVDNLTDQFSNINRLDELQNNNTDIDPFDSISQTINEEKKQKIFEIKTSDDTEGLITQALLLGNVEAAVELCLKAKRFADAIIIASTGGAQLLAKTQQIYLEQCNDYVSSIITALVTENWLNIINNCSLNSWKEALAASLTHSNDDELPSLCEQLGQRLENESNQDENLIKDAQLCYICSGNFDKLVNSWLINKNSTKKSTKELQELVELVTLLQRAIEKQGRQVQVTGALADLLSNYAMLLASQGHLITALNYLGTSQDNNKIVMLRERLYVSLGKKIAYEQQQQQTNANRRGSSGRQLLSNYSNYNNNNQTNSNQPIFNHGLPNVGIVNNQPWQTQQSQMSPLVGGGFNEPPKLFSPALPVSTVGGASVVPPPLSNVAPPLNQPSRPSSVGSGVNTTSSGSGGGGLPSRNKYVLDPSVSSNQYGNNVLNSRNLYQSPIQTQTGFSNNNFNSNNYLVANPNLNPIPLIPTNNNNLLQQQQQQEIMQPIERGQVASYNSSASGWNDPPVLNKPLRQQQPKTDLSTSGPITHPIYGTAPAQVPQPINDPIIFNPSGGVGEAPKMFQPLPLNNPVVGFNQNVLQTPSSGGYMTQQQQQNFVTQPPEKPQIIQKPPIPEEHIHMQTVLDELRNQCSCATRNPQTKRKLDDVSKKLEFLYDLLRENKLSPNTLTSLHQIIQFIQKGNYTAGLNLHTQLVSGQDFAQIASFMPGIKVLLQCALQLQVYLR